MPITHGNPEGVKAADIAFSIFADIDSSFFNVRRPEHEWGKFVATNQIKSNINPGATSHSYMVRDEHGTAAFVGNGPTHDIPMVGQSIDTINIGMAASAIGAQITNEDARQYAFGMNADLASDLGSIMRKGCDNLIERTVFFGEKSLGWYGTLALPSIEIMTASMGAGGSTEWDNKTADEMIADVNAGIQRAFDKSNTLFMTGTVFLPPKAFTRLASTYVTFDGLTIGKTALDVLKESNVFTALTGRPLEIQTLRYLKSAGAGGTGRMIIMDRDPDNQIMPFPLPYTLAQPVPAPLSVELFSEQKHGPYHVRQPLSMLYVDGV